MAAKDRREGRPDDGQAPEVTGRTSWDAAVVFGKTLGNLLPIIVIAGAMGFGFYKFFELSEQSQRNIQAASNAAAKQQQEELSNSNKLLLCASSRCRS